MSSDPIVRKAIIASIKSELMKIDWWDEVQDDVRARLEWIINHVEHLGTLFARTYMTLFRWEFERRRLTAKKLNNPYAGYVASLLGMRISEEAYQCGLLPTRSVLDLYDYVQPSDSDVAACLFLCHKIEVLETMGALVHNEDELKTTPSEMSKVIRGLSKRNRMKKRNQHGVTEEKLTWDANNDDD